MNDEIKEINIPENVLVALGDLTNGALNYYKASETVKVRHNTILDYITNLQQINKNLTNSLNNKVEEGIKLQLENDKLKEQCKQWKENHKVVCIQRDNILNNTVKDIEEQIDYKSRNERAIEYIGNGNL